MAVRDLFRVSAVALLAAIGLSSSPAMAACDATAPASSTVVTCDAGAHPETDAIVAPGSTDVEVDFEPNAALQTATSPAISLGGGALIDMMSGSMIADFDPSTVPMTIGGVINGDFSGVTDQTTLDALFGSIQTETPVRLTPSEATIDLGVTDPTARDDKIHEINAIVTVNKAQMADLAMSAVTTYISGSSNPTPRAPRAPFAPTPPASAGGPNTVFVDDGTVISGGAAAIRSAGDSALDVIVTGGGTIASLTENAPAVLLDGVGGLDVDLEDGTIESFFDGSAGIAGQADGTAVNVVMAGDSHILTAGDDAPAILGPGDDSVFNLEANRQATDAVPTIATFGDNSPGIFMHGAGGSTATLQFIGAGPGANPAFQTSGANSTLIDMDLGGNSSLSLTGENTSFGTFGDGSEVMSLLTGDSSDTLVYLLDSTLTSQGDNATLLETSLGASSQANFVFIGDAFTATGDGSGGIVHRVTGGGATSSDRWFIGTDTVSTGGGDAPAFLVEQGGESSVRSITVDNSSFTTQGANSAGFFFGGLGDSSPRDATFTTTTITTAGADLPGLFVGGVGTASAALTSLDTVTIATQGDNSGALTDMGVANDNSVFSFDMNHMDLSTQGANSIGVFLPMLRGTGGSSIGVTDFGNSTISTMGAGSTGMIVGDASIQSGPAPNIFDTSISISEDHTTIDTAGDGAAGFLLYGLGDGVSHSDSTAAFDHFTVTTRGDDARGVLLDLFSQDMSGSTFTLAFDNFTIDTRGDRSTGLIVGDGEGANTGIVGSTVDVSFDHTTINTAGDDAIGLIVEPIGPGATDSFFTVAMGNVTVTTSGANAHGIVLGEGMGTEVAGSNTANELRIGTSSGSTVSATTTGIGANALVISANTTLTLDDANVGATTANGTIVNGVIGSFDGFVATGDRGRAVQNNGIIYDTFTVGTDVRGNVANNGLIESAAGAGGVAVQYTGTTNDIFELQPLGVVIGTVEAGAGTDTFILGGEGAQTFDQTLIGTQYNGFETFEKEDGSTWTLENLSAIPLWDVKEGELVIQNEFIDPIAKGFTVHGGATLTLANTETPGADTGADNRFEIQPGATVNGNVFAGLGTDTFVLGGPGAASFDVALIGTQYNGFDSLLKEDASTWTLTGTNTVAAPFLVSGGTLADNATLANVLMTIGPDGRLQGNATLGGLVVNGTVAPGNSIGTISVAGDVVFNTGSTYEVEIAAPDQADLISATGTATVNGGALQIMLDPDTSYSDGQTYRIVEGGTGVVHNGDFTTNQPFSLLRTDVVYGTDFVDLLLTANIPFTTFAHTPNQYQSATGLQDLEQSGDALTVYNKIVQLSLAPDGGDAVRRAFDLASGEIYASGTHVLMSNERLFTGTLLSQGNAAIGQGNAGTGTETAPLGYASASPRQVDALAKLTGDDDGTHTGAPRGAFVAPVGSAGSIVGDGNAAAINWQTAGLIGGYETPVDVVFGSAVAGFGVGYLHSSAAVDARLSKLTSEGFHFGGYGAWTDGRYVATGAFAFGAASIDTTRHVMFGGIDRTAEASYWAQSVDLEAEVSRPFDIGDDTRLAPLATLSAGWMGHGAATETGAGSLNLTVASENQGWFDTGLGVSLSRRFVAANRINGMVEARVVWEHGFGSTVPRQGLAFAGSPTAFSVAGPDQGSDRLRLGLSLGVKVGPRADFRAGYDGMFSAAAQDHRANVGLTVHF